MESTEGTDDLVGVGRGDLVRGGAGEVEDRAMNKLSIQFRNGYFLKVVVDETDVKIILKMIYDGVETIMLEGRAVFKAEDVLYVHAEPVE